MTSNGARCWRWRRCPGCHCRRCTSPASPKSRTSSPRWRRSCVGVSSSAASGAIVWRTASPTGFEGATISSRGQVASSPISRGGPNVTPGKTTSCSRSPRHCYGCSRTLPTPGGQERSFILAGSSTARSLPVHDGARGAPLSSAAWTRRGRSAIDPPKPGRYTNSAAVRCAWERPARLGRC